tara:strand:+ start:4591 stop:6027 length:1437 start_codon:yes stop_codon:yes gene_type:complete
MKVVIVGGGSAGWMSACTLIKAFPDWDITLYESPNVPSVGVGESTTQFFRLWTHFLGLKDSEWMPSCDATYKCSVRFHNFHKQNDTPWQYPFGLPRQSICNPDEWLYYSSKQGWGRDKFARDYWLSAEAIHNNKIPVGHVGFDFNRETGFHFDAVKFAHWLRDNYAKPRGVKHKVEHVNKFNMESADLYFDCTGFRSLLNNSLWVDYSHYLPNNRAWVTRLPYTDKKTQIKAVTDCTALSSGWVWNVPTWDRIGTGYNFCSKYISEQDALNEFKEYLGVDHDDFRMISYNTGRRSEIWNGNVISIGLSGGFIEPLESNGLLSVHEFLLNFVRVMDTRTHVTQFMRDTFNNHCNFSFDGFSSFVGLHYALTQRDDSPYWKAVSEIRYPLKQGLHYNMFQNCQITFMEESHNLESKINWAFGDSLWCVMAGHGWNPFTQPIYNTIAMWDTEPPDYSVPPWEGIDSLPTPYEYYMRGMYAS